MDTHACFKINSPDVIHENVDNEVLIIEFNTGNYYSLNNSGADIWELLSAGAPVGEIIQKLKNKYSDGNGDIQSAVYQLVRELVDENLISPAETGVDEEGSGIEIDAPAEPGVLIFEIPVLQKFSDMQELLLLDPIHEVDETGWPAPKKD